MHGSIHNLSNRPVSLRLNTGVTRHIPPKGTIQEIMDVEVANNRGLAKLLDRKVVALDFTGGKKSGHCDAKEAIDLIRDLPAAALHGFLSKGEKRKTILDAYAARRSEG